MRYLACGLVLAVATGTGADTPRDSGIVERSEARLAQVDVSVEGPADVIYDLAPEDFTVRVNLTPIREFTLDRLCDPGGPTVPLHALFYFDQPHLTFAGRQSSISIAKELLAPILERGGRIMLASNAERVAILESFTDDHDKLHAALRRLEVDREQWSSFAQEERSRVDAVHRALDEENDRRAIDLARVYQMRETLEASKNIRRLGMTMNWLADVAAPKIVVYFADTFRSRPGEHYLKFFGEAGQRPVGATVLGGDVTTPTGAYDALVSSAAVHGVRFFTVLPRGLFSEADSQITSHRAIARTGTVVHSGQSRARSARLSLEELALETGGVGFTGGQTADWIGDHVLERFECVYLVSFNARGFRDDAPLRLKVEPARRDVRFASRGRLVLQSPEARRTSRLLSAFALGREGGDTPGVRAALVPTDFRDGRYRAMLQIRVAPNGLSSASWDLGASLVREDRVRQEAAANISVSTSGVPGIYEEEVVLEPGEWDVIAVAHEKNTDFIARDLLSQGFAPPKGDVSVRGPMVVLQPEAGAFVREGDVKREGAVVRAPSEPLDSTRPTALVALVCRGKRGATVVATRRLVGADPIDFPPIDLDLEEERCAQIRDLIPPHTLGPGSYRYEVRIDGAAAPTVREFRVPDQT